MCNSACIQFAKNNLKESDIKGKSVIEVGSLDINGTLRPIIEVFKPALYTGVDLFEGPGVDIVCDAKKLIDICGGLIMPLQVHSEILQLLKIIKLKAPKYVLEMRRFKSPSVDGSFVTGHCHRGTLI